MNILRQGGKRRNDTGMNEQPIQGRLFIAAPR